MRILLADDEPRVRFGLRVLLERQSGLEIVAEASDADELFAQLAITTPDILLVAWELPGLKAIGSVVEIRRRFPRTVVIAMSGRPEVGLSALGDGAHAFVSKTDPPEGVLNAILQIGPQEVPSQPTANDDRSKAERR